MCCVQVKLQMTNSGKKNQKIDKIVPVRFS